MAQRTLVQLTDDIDGSEAVETISFAFEGVEYEIDLNETNAADFREFVASYTGAGRRLGGRRAAPRRSARQSGAPDTQAIRAWAQGNGYQVSERGRISREVMAVYEAASR